MEFRISIARREYDCAGCGSKVLEGEEVTFLLVGFNCPLAYHPGCRQMKMNRDRQERVTMAMEDKL